jgi:HAD superfamily hydrolase (TIGR01509 family)
LLVVTDRHPAAVLWDMDGTLVDTEPYWMRSETELITSWGGTWTPEDGLRMVGMGLPDAARHFQAAGVGLEVDEIVALLTDRVLELILAEVPFRPGARELLAEVRAAGIPTAMVTMSMRRMALVVAEAIGPGSFDLIVGGDEVAAHKPDPEPYLHAARALGVDIADCVAIEDSAPGVASASSSGASTIAVPLHVALPDSPAYTTWHGLDGRTLADLAGVHGRAVLR